MSSVLPGALTIAGSDPSGGAGIQMDLKTFARTGVWGMAVITALTAQNAARVSHTWPLEPGIVESQIHSVLEDMRPGAIKTGMLANSGIIKVVRDTLPDTIPLIIDPVMVSTSGYHLLDPDAVHDMRECILPIASLVTPNVPEAEILAGMVISTEEDMIEAGRRIMDCGTGQVIVKGGHNTGEYATDLLIGPDEVVRLTNPRLPYEVHGSGCSFSAAITGYISKGYDIHTACQMGKTLISAAITDAIEGKSGRRIINP